MITEAFGVALVGYVASLALAQGSAKKFKYSVDDNQVEYAPAPLHSDCIIVLSEPGNVAFTESTTFPSVQQEWLEKNKRKKSLNHS